jgi:hypothetical protein
MEAQCTSILNGTVTGAEERYSEGFCLFNFAPSPDLVLKSVSVSFSVVLGFELKAFCSLGIHFTA